MSSFSGDDKTTQGGGTPWVGENPRIAGSSEPPFASNYVRLSGREWIMVAVVLAAALCLGPKLYERLLEFKPGPDYRLPYESGSDYWLYDRYCRLAGPQHEVLLIGDSVIWGHYVDNKNTLSHYLSRHGSRIRFANMGVDGIHPAALAGLMKYYGTAITGKKVVLHLNPLWMSSRKHDLQAEKEFHFNHPLLVPQFVPNIPCYKASYSKRISTVIERSMPLLAWSSHLRINYFDSMSLPAWTIEHPYENPLKAVTLALPDGETQSWTQSTIRQRDKPATKESFGWVAIESSLQWRFFRQAVDVLRSRGNKVFVLVGPFNEHMMDADNLEVYRRVQSGIETWLRVNSIAYCMPAVLPAELYHDASHPAAEGYAMLAEQLFENSAFASFVLE